MGRNKGLSSFSANFEAQLAAPIDARMVVDTQADLINPTTWTANDGGIYAYIGMLVTVNADTTLINNGVYRLIALPYTSADNWEQIGARTTPVLTVELGATFATNQAFKLIGGVALPVYSTDTAMPDVDGLTLESGVATNVVPCAMIFGNHYATPLALPVGLYLFLGQDGKPTATVPSSGAGDVWSICTIRQDDSTHFIFNPTTPIRLA